VRRRIAILHGVNSRNRQARIASVWGVVALIAAAGAALPSLAGIDGMAGGYAISVSSGFIALVGAIAAAVFYARARILAHLLRGHGVLVHWTYPDDARQEQTRKELAEETKGSWMLFWIIAAFCLVIGIGFLIADPEAGRFVLFVLLGIVALIAVVAALAPRIRYAKRRRAVPEAIVSMEGAYVLGMLHTWRLLGARVESADVSDSRRPVLHVTYSAPMVYGKFFYARQQYTVQIPVPPGETRRAEEVASFLVRRSGGA